MIKKSLAGSEQNIVDARCQHIVERTVTLYAYFLVGAVRSDNVDEGSWQFVAVLLIHPTLHALYYLRVLKAVDMVPSTSVVTVRREEATVVNSLECHAEVVALRIERIAGVRHVVLAVLADGGDEDVESSHAGMAVT